MKKEEVVGKKSCKSCNRVPDTKSQRMTRLKEFYRLSIVDKYEIVQMEGQHIGITDQGEFDVYEVGDFYAIVNETADRITSIRAVKNIPELR